MNLIANLSGTLRVHKQEEYEADVMSVWTALVKFNVRNYDVSGYNPIVSSLALIRRLNPRKQCLA
jgi:hypothetical protein